MSERRQQARPRPKFTAPRIDMSHGAGGKATHKLIEGLLLPALENPALVPLSDAALIPFGDAKLALTTVTPSWCVRWRSLAAPSGS